MTDQIGKEDRGCGAPQTVVLSGRLDVHGVGQVRDVLQAAVDAGDGPLVVDMSNAEMVDATCLGALVGSQHRAQRVGRWLVLRGTPWRLRRLLQITRLDRVLPSEDEPGRGRLPADRPGVSSASAA